MQINFEKGLTLLWLFAWGLVFPAAAQPRGQDSPPFGYYRYPAIRGQTIVFTAEGDLWRVGVAGGMARRLTSHPGEEAYAAFSPDGRLIAFSAQYEGPTEIYTMPSDGGLPTRRTFEGEFATAVGWKLDTEVLYTTRFFSTLPDQQLALIDLKSGVSVPLPLSQASDGAFDSTGRTLFFTRLPFQGSSTKRYKGGNIQQLWKFSADAPEADPLTADFPGTSKNPLFWSGRVFFISDRDGTMNLWSMNESGTDLKQLTHHNGWDVKSAALDEGRIVYQVGADLHLLDIATMNDTKLNITLTSDFDHEREKWVKKPIDYLTEAHLSPNGDRLVLTARGQVFVAPANQGRFVDATHEPRVRYRQARFAPDGKSLIALSDFSGELEFSRIPANGIGLTEQITSEGKLFRFDGLTSPDGKFIGFTDKDLQLWLFDIADKKSTLIDSSNLGTPADLQWSSDSQWLAYVKPADNNFDQIWLYHVTDGVKTALTSDRVNSMSPAWSPDGKFLYFLSDRDLRSVVPSPWGSRQPEPFFDQPIKIYLSLLTKDGRSPFEPRDELHDNEDEKNSDEKSKTAKEKSAKSKEAKDPSTDEKGSETNEVAKVNIDLPGIQNRIAPVPVPSGNFTDLAVSPKRLFWIARETRRDAKPTLMTLDIEKDDPKPKKFAEDVGSYELSLDGKKLLVRKGDDFFISNSDEAAPAKFEKSVDLKGWTFSLNPRDEWRQMFVESWRLMRDYFYDRNMHGVDWPAMLNKYLPLVDRVTDRAELSDLMSEMVGELSALHIFVTGGDFRPTPDHIRPGSLGAQLVRDDQHRGYRIEHIYQSDPDYPERASPLAKPGLDIQIGDVIESINGRATLSAPDLEALLRNQSGKQILLTVRFPEAVSNRNVIVTPISQDRFEDLRYEDWEYTRRLQVESLGKGDIGYVHLRAMGANDIAAWARNFYPVFNRKGLIVDVRHNRGGNIDSWILEKLMRKAWFFWQPRTGSPTWNMQYAFRGHLVVLCDQHTASDGEAFTEGFRRLGLGKVIGARTWGGEIWLTFSNGLVDKGIASAAEFGVYGPEGNWLIEGHGVEPDQVVDNLPHATFQGKDAQLEAAVSYLQEQIRLKPVEIPPPPAHPDKSFRGR